MAVVGVVAVGVVVVDVIAVIVVVVVGVASPLEEMIDVSKIVHKPSMMMMQLTLAVVGGNNEIGESHGRVVT